MKFVTNFYFFRIITKKKIMRLDLLLTEEIKATMPDTIKIEENFGEIDVRFDAVDPNEEGEILTGDSVIIEGDQAEVIKWLKPFGGVPIGCGVPQLEEFTICHIKDDL